MLHSIQNCGKRILLQWRFWGISCECMVTSHVTWLVLSALILWGGHKTDSLISVNHQDTWCLHVLSMASPKDVNFTQIKKEKTTKNQESEDVSRSGWIVSVSFLLLILPKAAWVSSSTHETFFIHLLEKENSFLSLYVLSPYRLHFGIWYWSYS